MTQFENLTPEQLVQKDRENVWHHLMQHQVFQTQEPVIMVEGKGCTVKDIRGKEYLDAASGGVWCVNVGYGQDSIAEAVYEQLKQLPFYALTAGNVPAILLAEKVTSLLPGLQKVFFSNSGSEANEKAFKMSRQYFRQKYPQKDKYKILYRQRDYHGTTLAALSATGQSERKTGYGPMAPGFVGDLPPAYCYRCHYGKSYPGCNLECAHALEDIIKAEREDTVAAVILEPITAGGGVILPVSEYYGIIEEICHKYEVLLIFDEVVNGFGRTGKWFGHQHWDVDPDMITAAKGMASSYIPLSATITKQYIFEQFLSDPSDKMSYFRDISTYGGSLAAFAAGRENIRLIEEQKLCENSAAMGEVLLDGLKELESLPIVGEVRGKGLFVGVELVEDKKTKTPVSETFMGKVAAEASKQGVLFGRTNRSIPGHNNIVTIAPALVVTKDEINRMVSTLKDILVSLSK
ncbi:adenosylmethionine-8-amino-7-oxononanoate aminotransferase [Desulfitobacterium dichloroeliminans LMG P-21439]|uniref:Adenosylmethionine-8-amino-7-oxononanoate aminotransferase n=1 Tax=Desulfitobacterium dichloroeliminans (strain LMG P-21439 / DCA1) TaxID=871963 RepID=L0F1S7_DESDL|nr:aminotransferase [Desulfitobacterium dichloroeliminans]AGA67819.1 adenosylmethionine-8-amino-7-oxononanoate aminotransferase [Desulfitobacterium dichloroeliminans LMG P-21439]